MKENKDKFNNELYSFHGGLLFTKPNFLKIEDIDNYKYISLYELDETRKKKLTIIKYV